MYEYNGVFQCGVLVANCLSAKTRDFSSAYASVSNMARATIHKYMQNYKAQMAG